ncbi:MAG: hypothetical protein OHK0040_04130 [bacterium]
MKCEVWGKNRAEERKNGRREERKAFLCFPQTSNPKPHTSTFSTSTFTFQLVKGFTLIEVLVALFIVASVFVTILSTFSYHISLFERKKDELKLVLIAKDKIYQYKTGKLKQLEGEEEGIKYQVLVQDAELGLKKVISKAYTKDEEVELYDYFK